MGYDDQILADPIGDAAAAADSLIRLIPVSEEYLNGSTRLFLRWDDLWGSDRLEMIAHASGITYGTRVDGEDTNRSLAGTYRRRLSPQVAVDLSGSGYLFRRKVPTLVRDVFDFNLYRMEARLGWAADEEWLLTAGIHQDWITFPGRSSAEDSSRNETQQQFNLEVGGIRRFKGGGFVAGQMNYRWTRSNVDTSEYATLSKYYEGPVFSMRTRGHLTRSLEASAYVAFGHRNYETEQRNDDTWQFGATLERRLSPRFSVFLEGSLLHQVSSDPEFDFDQTRVDVGISINLIPPRVWSSPSFPKPLTAVAPQIIQRAGVRFRYLAPEAKEVWVVGGFNGWDAASHELQGPDSEGIWETVIPLQPGVWRYAFVVDGVWVPPQEAPRYEEDGFGGRHGVLEVPVSPKEGSVTAAGEIRQMR